MKKRMKPAEMLAAFRELDQAMGVISELTEAFDLGEHGEAAVLLLEEQGDVVSAAALRDLAVLRAELGADYEVMEAKHTVLGEAITRVALGLDVGARAVNEKGVAFIVDRIGFCLSHPDGRPTCYASGKKINPSGTVSKKLGAGLWVALPEDFA